MIYYDYYYIFDIKFIIAIRNNKLVYLNEELKFHKKFKDYKKYKCNNLQIYKTAIDKLLFNKQKLDIEIDIIGTSFEKIVWFTVINTEYSSTYYFSEIAHQIGNPDSSRAVARALKYNPILIVIPSHRIIKKNGPDKGSPIKKKLLQLEIN